MGPKGTTIQSTKLKLICYWIVTIVVATELLVGGVWDLTQRADAVQVVTHIGYPAYVLTILGFWKLLAVIAWIVPGYPTLKEWAYAGVFFELTGAAASHVLRGNPSEAILPLILAALSMASWALRPSSRRFVMPPSIPSN